MHEDSNTATLIFIVIMTTGVVVWTVSLWRVIRLGRSAPNFDVLRFENETDLPFDDYQFACESGSALLKGQPDELSKALLLTLKRGFMGQLESIYQIRRHPDCRIVLKKNGPLMCNLPLALYFTDADITFQSAGGNTVEVIYRLGFGRLIRLVKSIAIGIIFGVGLPVLLIVGAVIWFFVIPSGVQGVRWQVFQTGQIVHALWPPYLILWLYGTGRAQSKTWLANVINYLDADCET